MSSFFAIRTFPALLLSLTFPDHITSRWHLEYRWKVSLTAICERPQQGLLFLPHGLLTTPVPHTTGTLPNLPQMPTLHTSECALTMAELFTASASGTLREAFCIGTAAVVIPTSTSGDMEAAEANAVQGICYLLLWRGQHPAQALGVACGCSGGARRVGGVGHAVRSCQRPQFRHQHCLPTMPTPTLRPDNTNVTFR